MSGVLCVRECVYHANSVNAMQLPRGKNIEIGLAWVFVFHVYKPFACMLRVYRDFNKYFADNGHTIILRITGLLYQFH